MKYHETKTNNHLLTYTMVAGLSFVILIIVALLLKVNYLEAKSKFEKAGQKPTGEIQPVTKSDYVEGNPQAKVTLVEYSDFECPQCQYFHPTLNKLLSYYGDNIRLVSRRFPLPQNQNAEKEAEAALCAGKLGGNTAFWRFSEKIFGKVLPTEGGTGLALDTLPVFAKEVGINQSDFETCLSSGKMASTVKFEETDGSSAGVFQLPGTFVIDSKGNTILLSGNQSFDVMKTVIDQALAL